MRALIDFLVNSKHWFLFILLEVVSLMLLFSYNGYQKSVYFTTANNVVGFVYEVVSYVESYVNLRAANATLEQDNEILHREVYRLNNQIAELRLDSLKPMGLSADYNFVNAQVVKSSLHRKYNLITINRGEADGIKPEMGVVSSHGVVGIVYMTSKHYSIVMPLINEHTKVSCRLRGSDFFGTMSWERSAQQNVNVTGIPRHAKVKKRDIVETNGFSAIFPPGLPIGRVGYIGDSPDGMSYLLKVIPFADFATLREVSVITNYIQPERLLLEEKADSVSEATTF